jgi:hypothetical protein
MSMRLVTFTQVDGDKLNNPRLIAINPEYVVAVEAWNDSTSEITLDISSTTRRVFVLGSFEAVVRRFRDGK